jgi:hypothetical protein
MHEINGSKLGAGPLWILESLMARQSTTESAEYQRLASLAISPEDKALKRTLFATFVDDFAAQLLPDVKGALESEASSDIADEWIREATSALKTLAPELPADLDQRVEFQRAVERTQKELTAEFCKDVLKPSDAEIQRESVELAQCILANWFALLEHAMEEAPSDALPLTANGIPENRSLDDLYLGVEAFAVSREKLASLFDEFLTSRFAVGEPRTLAPQLFLARRAERKFFISSTDEMARSLARPPNYRAGASHSRSHSSADLFERIYELLPTRATAVAGNPSPSAYVEQYLARAAARLARTAYTEELSPVATLRMDRFSHFIPMDLITAQAELDLASNKLSENLALVALYDLDSALGSSTWERIVSWRKRHAVENSLKTEALAAVGERVVPSLRRVATTAAGYVVACQMTSDNLDESDDFTGLKQIFDNYPKAQTVLCLSAVAAHQAASLPQATTICTRMSQQFDL